MRTVLLVAASMLGALPVAGQYYFPLPPAFTGDTVCVAKSFEQSNASIPCAARWSNFSTLRGSLGLRDGQTYKRTLLSKRIPWEDSDAQLREFYRNDGLQYFRAFTATIRDDRIYVGTSLLGGLLGRTYFDLSIAKVVASADPGDPDPEAFEDGVAGVYRLVNNGGSVAMHLLMPMYAGGGTLSQRTFGFFVQAGGMGPLDDPEAMAGTAGVGAELLVSMAVRDSNYETRGELFLGLRGALQWVSSGSSVVLQSTDKSVPFAQLSVGVRASSGVRLAATLTALESDFDEFMPTVQFSLQTSPGG